MPGVLLTTPIYLKSQPDMPWPNDPVFYLLTSEGLFLCRNHRFFKSSVLARNYPRELSWHNASLHLAYPRIPRFALEQIMAFFISMGEHYSAEAIVLLAWDDARHRVRIVVPEQVATVGENQWHETWPIAVEYELPSHLPAGWTLFGDVHSHVDGPAFASHVDRNDEAFQAGLHIIFGRVFQASPDFSAQAVVDGARFTLQQHHVLEGYRRPARRFPQRWLEQVRIQRPGRQPQPIAQRAVAAAPDDPPRAEPAAESGPTRPSRPSRNDQEEQA